MTLHIGDAVPDFEAEPTQGRMRWQTWIEHASAILYSQPKPCTPQAQPAAMQHRRRTRIAGATMKILIGGLSLAASLCLAAHAAAEATSGFADGYVSQPYNAPGVALLDSFYFRYSDGDHHVASLAAQPESNGEILLALADDNNDDEYFYLVEHKRRSDAGIITGSFVDFCNGSCLYPLPSPGAGYVFTLRGFRFYYRDGDDHHMDQIGIVHERDGVRTYFNDESNSDPYVVYVDYAWLPVSMVEQTGQLTGTDEGGGGQRTLSNANRAIISGFKVDYLNGDHHVKEIGVLTRTSDIQIYYGDENGDDDFAYFVDYTILRDNRLGCRTVVCGSGNTQTLSTQELAN